MKTRTWIILLAALLVLCLGLSLPVLLPSQPAASVKIYSGGELIATLPLSLDRELAVTAPGGGENTVTIRHGAVAVTAATCPDHYCMHRGFCTGGSSIVCLPNQLVIEFVGEQDVDFVAG